MTQFYFLSILFNIIAGLILVYGENFCTEQNSSTEVSEVSEFTDETEETEEKAKKENAFIKKVNVEAISGKFDNLNNEILRLITGILCVFVGLMKLLSVYRNDIPVIGDLVPVIAGFAGGASLLLEYFILHSTTNIELKDNVKKVFIDSRKYIGLFCMLAGILHFVFPQVILL